MPFGQEVKRLRIAKGMTQKELAKAVGFSQPFLSELENGASTGLGLDAFLSLCDALGVDCGTLRRHLPSEWPESTAPRGKGKPSPGAERNNRRRGKRS